MMTHMTHTGGRVHYENEEYIDKDNGENHQKEYITEEQSTKTKDLK